MAVLEAAVVNVSGKGKAHGNMEDKKKVLLIAQELKLARALAGNNKTDRDRALKYLKKWLKSRSAQIDFTEEDFLRIWKGLFYSMWMSDKLLVQEECADNIANLVHELPLDSALLFYKCGMSTLINEWFGIDQLRLNKFQMLVRRFLRQILFVLKKSCWNRKDVLNFSQVLSSTILDTEEERPLDLLMHFTEVYLEEIAKVGERAIPPHLITDFLNPFIRQLACSDDLRILKHIRTHIFNHLMEQSDVGLEYKEKYNAWKQLGFPGSIDSMKKIEIDQEIQEEETDVANGNKPLDPRAGRVDVILPQIKFSPRALAKVFSNIKFEKFTNSKSRKCLNELAENFQKLASGVYPLGSKKLGLSSESYDTSVKKAVNRLVKFDQKIMGKKKSRKRQNKDGEENELQKPKKVKFDKQSEQNNGNIKKLIAELRKKCDDEVAERDLRDLIDVPIDDIEFLFRRNSGVWCVTESKAKNQSVEKKIKKRKVEKKQNKVNKSNQNQLGVLKKDLFHVDPWDGTADEKMEQNIKRSAKRRHSHPGLEDSLPQKRVKFNVRLNEWQDERDHFRKVLLSPAIPFDADKRPSKSLLKSSYPSLINPFYMNNSF